MSFNKIMFGFGNNSSSQIKREVVLPLQKSVPTTSPSKESSRWLLKPLTDGDQGDDIYFSLPNVVLCKELKLHCQWEHERNECNVSSLANYTIFQWGPHINCSYIDRPLIDPDKPVKELLLNLRPKSTTVKDNKKYGLWLWFTF